MENNSIYLKENTKSKREIDKYDLFFLIMMIFILLMTIIVFIIVLNTQKNCITVYVAKSNIEGEGLYSAKDLKTRDNLFMAIDKYNSITYLGSKINHSNNPNTELVKINDSYYILSLYDIEKNKELTIDYNKTPDFITKPDPSWK
jgi:hypothetical protein